MTEDKTNWHPLADLLNKYHYLSVAIAFIGGVALFLIFLKDVIFRGGSETTLGLNSFIAIFAVGVLIIFAIVVDARAKNRALSERADKLGDMAKRMHTALEEINAANEELVRNRLQADFANQAKSEFLSKLSDEISAPIKAILSDALKLRGAPGLGDGDKRIIDDLALNPVNLSSIIADVVEIARMEAEGSNFTPTDFDLGDLIAGLEKDIGGQASGRGKSLEFDIQPRVWNQVNGDGDSLRSVLEFLLTNALDTNKEGAVSFSVSLSEEGMHRFEVRDRGQTYSADVLAEILQPFHRNEGERFKGATGLGLAIADKRITDMGGELSIRCEEGEGTIFAFQLRLSAAGAAGTEASAAADD